MSEANITNPQLTTADLKNLTYARDYKALAVHYFECIKITDESIDYYYKLSEQDFNNPMITEEKKEMNNKLITSYYQFIGTLKDKKQWYFDKLKECNNIIKRNHFINKLMMDGTITKD
jgi:hypothetical protein